VRCGAVGPPSPRSADLADRGVCAAVDVSVAALVRAPRSPPAACLVIRREGGRCGGDGSQRVGLRRSRSGCAVVHQPRRLCDCEVNI
jgi:hypothetical protein